MHRPLGEADPIFEPLRAHATRFDARLAVESIDRETGGIKALAARHRGALLRVDLKAPGYAANDVPPGGALLFERLRDVRSGLVYIRVSYRTQSLRELRGGTPATTSTPLLIPGCAMELCRTNAFVCSLRSRLADTVANA